eukprot:258559_1
MSSIQREILSFILDDMIYNKYFWKWSVFQSGCWLLYKYFVRSIYIPKSSKKDCILATNHLFSFTHCFLTCTSGLYYYIKYKHSLNQSNIMKVHKFPLKSNAMLWVDYSISYFILDLLYLMKYEPKNITFYIHHMTSLY